MSKTHWSCAEMAAMSLPGYPTTKRAWIDLVARERWESRQRTGRGGGLEYRPSPAVAALILATLAQPTDSSLPAPVPALVAAPATPSVPAALSTSHALTDRQRLERDARTGVLAAIRRLQDQAQCSLEAAMTTLLVGARADKLDAHLDRMLRLARDPRGRAGDGYPSIRTLRRWLGAEDLTPRQAVQDMAVPPWAGAFLRCYQQPQKPALAEAYRQFCAATPANARPSIHQVRRFIGKIGAVSLEAGRRLPRDLKNIKPFIRRTTGHMWPDDCYTADGHTFDAEVAHPRHGKAFRPEITSVLSVATRKCVGWSIGLSESTWAVLDALRHAVETHGIPALWYVDNGSGYRNAMQADEVVGFAARLGIQITHSLPYNSQARGIEERSHQTLWVAAAKRLPTYMGADMDREARQRVHKITRAHLRASGASALLMDFEAFKAFAQAAVDEYNARPHRGLPKFIDAQGKRRHMSPNEAWQASLDEGWAPSMLTPAERDDLFRPYTLATVTRGEIRLFNNLYFSGDLEEFHGQKVRVGYDIHDAGRVWVRSHRDGSLICVAEFEANHRAYFAQSVIDQAAQKRAEARAKRLQGHLEEVREELAGTPAALEHQAPVTVEAIGSIREKLEAREAQEDAARQAAQVIDLARRPMFGDDYEKYHWLRQHPDAWDGLDAAWLLDWTAGPVYQDMESRYIFLGQDFGEDLRQRAEHVARKEWAAGQRELSDGRIVSL